VARRRSILVHAAVALLGGTVLMTALPGVAQAAFTFDGVAAADGTEATAANPSIPLGVTLTGAGPSAQARLTSLPTSDAFASFPFPGEALAGAPGVANGVLPVPLFPAYPFIINSGLGDDPRSQTAPGLSLEATSERLASRSRAVVGSDASGSESTAQVSADPDNGVTALAHSVTRGLEILDSITFAVVDSSAKAVRDSSGALSRSSSLSFSRLSIPGLGYTLPSNSPAFAGQAISGVEFSLTDGQFYVALPFAGAPKNVPVSSESVIAALKSAGITATYQAPIDTTDGIVGAAFSMATDLPAPPPNGSYDGPTHVTYTVGRSSASVSLNPIPAFNAGAPPTGTSTPADGAVPLAGVDAVGLPSAPGSVPGTAPSTVTPRGLPTVDLRPAGATRVVPTALSRRAFDSGQISDLYLLIAALGGLGFLCLRAIRLRGVRLR
jgi:hypothetical protein